MTGSELKKLRRGIKLRQADLAAKLGMARETIGLMERGHAPISIRTKLAVLYLASGADCD